MEQFWNKVDKNGAGGCWNWTASCRYGYGKFGLNGKTIQSHRLSYELANGDIPEGLIVRHKCKQNRKCVNPDHLEVGTYQDNRNDMIRDGTLPKGETHGRSKLTDTQVKEIRALYAVGDITQRNLAKSFAISQREICRVVNNKSWKHLLVEENTV
jgi:hypothetical protein